MRSLLLAVVVALPAFAGDVTRDVAAGNTAFAFELYAKLAIQPGNLFFSPYSISNALGMTWAGARGNTATEMAKTLHFTSDLHAGLAALNKQLTGTKLGYQLAVANRLYVQQGLRLLAPFEATTKTQYKAPVEQVDFSREATRLNVNHWVEDQTNHRIKDLIAPGIFTGDTRMALINAIYFKGSWATCFEKKSTTTQKFFTGGVEVDVPLMQHSFKADAHVRVGAADGVQVLELPYKGGDLTMVVLLPTERDGLPALEKTLTAARFEQLLATLRPGPVEVWLPRFHLDASLAAGDTLAGMGMPLAFSAGADFSGISGTKGLFISAVIHKAFVDVNEEGTEAAAATAVVMAIESVEVDPVFRADHPFLFALRDAKSGSVLFLGRLDKP